MKYDIKQLLFKLPAMTYASLKSYEVRHQATTFSTILAEKLKLAPSGDH